MSFYEQTSTIISALSLIVSMMTLLAAILALTTWKKETKYSFETNIRTEALRNIMGLEGNVITALGREYRTMLPVSPKYDYVFKSNIDVDRDFDWLYHSVYFSTDALARWEKLGELHRFVPAELTKSFHQSRGDLLSEIERIIRFSDSLIRDNFQVAPLDGQERQDRIDFLFDKEHNARNRITAIIDNLINITNKISVPL